MMAMYKQAMKEKVPHWNTGIWVWINLSFIMQHQTRGGSSLCGVDGPLVWNQASVLVVNTGLTKDIH